MRRAGSREVLLSGITAPGLFDHARAQLEIAISRVWSVDPLSTTTNFIRAAQAPDGSRDIAFFVESDDRGLICIISR